MIEELLHLFDTGKPDPRVLRDGTTLLGRAVRPAFDWPGHRLEPVKYVDPIKHAPLPAIHPGTPPGTPCFIKGLTLIHETPHAVLFERKGECSNSRQVWLPRKAISFRPPAEFTNVTDVYLPAWLYMKVHTKF